ncbi:hypothetical protein EG831_04810 [bacterium]|nr:hypothetical protein [bacterium]
MPHGGVALACKRSPATLGYGLGLLLAPLATLFAAPLAAEEASLPDYADETLSGDWGGRRTDLYRRGIALEGLYRVDALRNTSGGLQRGGRPMTHLELRMAADLDKLQGWADTTAFVSLLADYGSKVNAAKTGSLLGVSNIEAPVSTHRLFHAWVQKDFGDRQWSLLAGLYPIDSEFMVMDAAGVFMQPPYGALGDLALTRGPSIFNNSAIGLRLKWTAADRAWYVQGAVLDGVPGNPSHPKGTHIALGHGDGIMSIAEFGYRPGEAGHVFEPTTPDVGMPVDPVTKAHELAADSFGKYAVGVWGYSARANDLIDTDAAGAPLRRRSRGWYALAEQTLASGTAIGDISVFCRVSATDGASTAIRTTQTIGLRLKGPLPGLEHDVLGLAHIHAGLGEKFRQAQAAAAIAAASSETAWELTYRHQHNRWLGIQPVVQRFRHPGGDLAHPRASVVGLRLEIAL